jgi:hypothetical protein
MMFWGRNLFLQLALNGVGVALLVLVGTLIQVRSSALSAARPHEHAVGLNPAMNTSD